MKPRAKQVDLDLVLMVALEGSVLYGLEIVREVNRRTDGAIALKEGTLYPVLYRLESAGWVESNWETREERGTPRKYYHLTDEGLTALEGKKQEWESLTHTMSKLLGPLGRLV